MKMKKHGKRKEKMRLYFGKRKQTFTGSDNLSYRVSTLEYFIELHDSFNSI